MNDNGICPSLTSAMGGGQIPMHNYQQHIRKLTPTECFRLMGFGDGDIEACRAVGISDSQLYKQAGNSIVVNVLMAIFGQLYGVPWQEKVYGKWWKPPSDRYDDLPIIMQHNERN